MFDCCWCFVLSFIAVAGHVTDDATVTTSPGELRFAGAQCKRFAFSFPFAFVSGWKPRVRGVAFTSSFAFALRRSSPPSAFAS